jgi:hypothetical protein
VVGVLDAIGLRGDRRLSLAQTRAAYDLGREHARTGVRALYDPMDVWALIVVEPRDAYCPGSGVELLAAYRDGVRSAR